MHVFSFSILLPKQVDRKLKDTRDMLNLGHVALFFKPKTRTHVTTFQNSTIIRNSCPFCFSSFSGHKYVAAKSFL